MVECTQGIRRDRTPNASNIVARLSRKLRIFSAAVYCTKLAAWNGSHPDLGFWRIDAFIAKLCAENDVHISAPSVLDLRPCEFKIALPVSPHGGNVPALKAYIHR